MKIRNLLLLSIASMLLIGCTAGKNVPYMTNIDDIPAAALAQAYKQVGDFNIKPGDLLQINVAGSNPDVVKPFNKVHYVPSLHTGSSYNMGDGAAVYYNVDDNGNIDFPVLGRLHVAGMTKSAIEEYVTNLIYPRYMSERPNVECRIENFRVYCIGEFSAPGVISASNGRLNLIEAIAMCRDLTLQGRRDNILLIRTDSHGERSITRFDLNDATIMTKPEFQLQQNDILYVQPTEYRARQVWSSPPLLSFSISMLSTAMSIVTFVTVMSKK